MGMTKAKRARLSKRGRTYEHVFGACADNVATGAVRTPRKVMVTDRRVTVGRKVSFAAEYPMATPRLRDMSTQTTTHQLPPKESNMSKPATFITITDTCGDSGTVTVDTHDVADAIRPWYPDAPAEVVEWIDTLQTALDRGDYTGDMESALGISIEYATSGITPTMAG